MSGAFFVGCHSRATAGHLVARLYVGDARLLAQNGHPDPRARLPIDARHS
jgi:hypothetical protein